MWELTGARMFSPLGVSGPFPDKYVELSGGCSKMRENKIQKYTC